LLWHDDASLDQALTASVRAASILFALQATLIVLINLLAWVKGAPPRIHAFPLVAIVGFAALAVYLWQQVRSAAVVGLIVSMFALLLFSGALWFWSQFLATDLYTPLARVELRSTLIAAMALNLAIALSLVRALRSGRRPS